MTTELDALPESVQRAVNRIGIYVDEKLLGENLDVIRAELLRLTERCDKFKWQVRDTCARAEKAEARVQELERENAELDASESQLIDERDRAQDALQKAHIELGGDGEWVCKMGAAADYPPDSGDLHDDVPALASEVRARAERAETELTAIRKRIAESATATLRITYEEDRAMGVHLRDMDIGALCWLDGECVRLLPLDDEAKS